MHGEPNKDPALDVVDVTVGYQRGLPVFVNASFSIMAGGLVHVQGPNGAGKSTLVELASGYLRPWSGLVRVGGLTAGTDQARSRRRVCRTRPSLYPQMTVHDHLVFSSQCVGVSPEMAFERAVDIGLEPWLATAARSLSTGNARKLWYLVCTSGEFDTVFLDEPFNGLDSRSTAILVSELQHWSKTRTVILIAHNLAEGLTPDSELDLGHSQEIVATGAIAAAPNLGRKE